MKPKQVSFLFLFFAILASCFGDDNAVNQKEDLTTEAALAAALVPVIINSLQGLLSHLFRPSDYQDIKKVVLFGRSMRLKTCTGTCVQLSDLASGITEVGTGETQNDALNQASYKMLNELLFKKILTIWDLCHLNINFPHPDAQQCQGVVINSCDLTHPVLTTKKPCNNDHGDAYCERYKERCNVALYQTFMNIYCLKTCTNGLCGNDSPSDPCAPNFF